MTGPRATLVLVHGAWHGSWCWGRLIPQLEARRLAVRTVDLPSVHGEHGQSGADLRDDANAVRAAVESVAGPVVLCGHSYGGMVISLAAARQIAQRVVRLVYLCAFMPEARQSLVGIGGNQHAPWIRMLDDDMTLPDLSRAGEVFYGDCDPATQEWAIGRLKPQCNAAFIVPVARPAWKVIPSTYIICARDAAMPAELQRNVFAPRAERVLELETSHSPFLSRPAWVADALAAEI